MQIDLREKEPEKAGPVARQNLQPRLSKPRQGENIEVIPADSKIPVEIRDILLIKPQDFYALKQSFEEWAMKWENY